MARTGSATARVRAAAWLVALLLPVAAAAQGPAGFAGENEDFGVPATRELRLKEVSAPTPLEIPGARTVKTAEILAQMKLQQGDRAIYFDVLGGGGHNSIPGAIWLADAGRGESFDDELQARLAKTLEFLARGDMQRPMVFFCGGNHCWLSYNAALRAVKLGYTAVGWYRGGLEAWREAGGPLAPMRFGWQRPPAPQ